MAQTIIDCLKSVVHAYMHVTKTFPHVMWSANQIKKKILT